MMTWLVPRKTICVFLGLVALPAFAAASRRRAVVRPSVLTREKITLLAVKIANCATIDPFDPRLHWENVPFLDGIVTIGEEMERESKGSGSAFVDRAATVILQSHDNINVISWGDGTAYSQVVMNLYRLTPPTDTRRQALLATLSGPIQFAEHAIRVSPALGPPREPWWIPGGYGTRYWQDDMYTLIPWLAMYGSSVDDLPGNELARNLAYEWVESYVYDHRPAATDPREVAVPTANERHGFLLWDPDRALFQHAPETIGSDNFWGRGNGWAVMGLMAAARYLDEPYSGTQYSTIIGTSEIRQMLVRAAASLKDRRTPDGGWGTSLSRPIECPVAETSATGFITFFLARGVNEGWLDRGIYLPVVLKAFALLTDRIDNDGNVSGIQPPGTGPACGAQTVKSNNGTINVNYGVGAVLLAAAELLKFSDEDLNLGQTGAIRRHAHFRATEAGTSREGSASH